MATISALPYSIPCRAGRTGVSAWLLSSSHSASSLPSPLLSSRLPFLCIGTSTALPRTLRKTVRAVAEEEEEASAAQVSDGDADVEEAKVVSLSDQPVSVPVSPSDMLTMFFKAEGTMDESGVAAVSKAVEGMEGVSDLKVQILEGIASVELRKQTTVQATGVASNLVEIIQGSGLKLQTLNLSFEDEEDAIN